MQSRTIYLEIKKSKFSSFIIFISLLSIFSLLYQVYFYGFDSGNIEGGGVTRFVVKVVSVSLLLVVLHRYFSVRAILCNLHVKAPIYFICFNYIILAPLLDGTYIQALNSIFMLPILFVDWSIDKTRKIFIKIWCYISIIVFTQLIIEPFLKANYRIWENGAFIGGVANPNSFGLLLIISGSFFIKFYHSLYIKLIGLLLILSTIFTGSLASFIAGGTILLVILDKFISKLFAILIIISAIFLSSNFENSPSVVHLYEKFNGLIMTLFNLEGNVDSESLRIRGEYTMNGLKMLIEHPASIIFGHPNFLPMYNGDGLIISMMVTFGLPFTLYFLYVNLYLMAKWVNSKNSSMSFSSLGLMVYLIFFISNRILDYWPMALPYFLCLSFLASNTYSTAHHKLLKKMDAETPFAGK